MLLMRTMSTPMTICATAANAIPPRKPFLKMASASTESRSIQQNADVPPNGDRRREAKEKERKRQKCITALRMEAFRDIPATDWSFERAAVLTTPLQTVRNYADHWEEMQQNNIGLILFGNVGTGKSYAAGCVANAVIDRMVSVGFIAVADIVNRMQGLWGDDCDRFMRSLMRSDLLILDDLGAERNTSYGKECVFDVINRRRLSGKPMIVITNIPLKYMQQTTDMDERRIFDRILECCMPVQFDCQNFRQVNRQENMKKAIRLLNGN